MAGRSYSVRRRSRYVGSSTPWAIASDRWGLGRPGAAGTSCPAERASSSSRCPQVRKAKWTLPATGWRSRRRPGALEAAELIDLLRIADASDARMARRDSLALQAVLDVQREREAAGASDERAAGDRIAEWLSQQTPVA